MTTTFTLTCSTGHTHISIFNPFTPRRIQVSPFSEILRRDRQKISYERRVYESVDEKAYLRLIMSRKTTKKVIWPIKG